MISYSIFLYKRTSLFLTLAATLRLHAATQAAVARAASYSIRKHLHALSSHLSCNCGSAGGGKRCQNYLTAWKQPSRVACAGHQGNQQKRDYGHSPEIPLSSETAGQCSAIGTTDFVELFLTLF